MYICGNCILFNKIVDYSIVIYGQFQYVIVITLVLLKICFYLSILILIFKKFYHHFSTIIIMFVPFNIMIFKKFNKLGGSQSKHLQNIVTQNTQRSPK